MKKYFWIAILFMMLPLTASAETRVMVVSDLHLMAPQLYEGSDLLEQSLLQGDGKVSHRSRELAEALVAEAIHQKPDVLVVTGDLSFNGEYRSHLFVAQTLRRITGAGIPVCVIPGNHDICTWIARDYSSSENKSATTISAENFAHIYADLMPGEAAPEGCGFSYVCKVSESLQMLMLDTCWYDPEEGQAVAGYVREGLCDWISTVLDEAQQAGVQVISATHKSLFPHSSFRESMYMVQGGDEIASLMTSHGMKLNLSGHIHAQLLLEKEDLWDAALGAFCMSPHLYAMVTVGDDGSVGYEAVPTCESHFPEGFAKMSLEFFRHALLNKLELPEGLTEEEQEQAAEVKFMANYAYFSGTMGTLAAQLPNIPGWQMLQEKDSEGTLTGGILTMLQETGADMRQLRIP